MGSQTRIPGARVGPLRPGDPRRVGGYRLTGLLGEGGMGQVFLGRSRAGRMVAVQVVDADPRAERPWMVTAYIPPRPSRTGSTPPGRWAPAGSRNSARTWPKDSPPSTPAGSCTAT